MATTGTALPEFQNLLLLHPQRQARQPRPKSVPDMVTTGTVLPEFQNLLLLRPQLQARQPRPESVHHMVTTGTVRRASLNQLRRLRRVLKRQTPQLAVDARPTVITGTALLAYQSHPHPLRQVLSPQIPRPAGVHLMAITGTVLLACQSQPHLLRRVLNLQIPRSVAAGAHLMGITGTALQASQNPPCLRAQLTRSPREAPRRLRGSVSLTATIGIVPMVCPSLPLLLLP